MDLDQAVATLCRLYELVDRQVRTLVNLHGERLLCRKGCSGCCRDDLTVFEVEAEHIRRHHSGLLASASPGTKGACAFLDAEGACRIYESRPYVCRTQGLPLRWIDEHEDGTPVEMRDICPLNEIGPPIEILDEDQCWTIGPFEEALADLQTQCDDGQLSRVTLRSLFSAPESH